jgi:hypothetical protein
MRSIPLLLATVLSSFALFAAEPAAPSASAGAVKLLTIGNSFSANATKYLPALAQAGGHKLIHKPIVVGGAPLELHAKKFQVNERDPADPAGLYTGGRSLKQMLRDDRWDYVTIQQASIKSHDIATYRPFAQELQSYIQNHAPQAKLLVHQTWEYRSDDPRFAVKTPKAGELATQDAMYRGLTSAYQTITQELGARRIPVGDAFHAADTDPKWGYQPDTKFDFKNAMPPALPDQSHSLHAGWTWRKEKDGSMKLGMDGHHANAAGQYLGACVWYEVLFGESVVGNSFVPPGVDRAYAKFLQETAHAAVKNAETK